MKHWLRRPSTYLALPLLAACGLTALTYDLPPGYAGGLGLLVSAALGLWLYDSVAGARQPPLTRFRVREYAGTRDGFVALAFAAAIVLFCVLDLLLFPVPLLDNPRNYATMENGREHIRHISDMCWTLPPIALLCIRQRGLRYALLVVGVAFPILVIDRNRIFASLFALAMTILLRRDPARPVPWKIVGVLGLAGAGVFSALGMLRSGSLDTVALPFSDFYRAMPQGIKWLLLYISAGPYNFAAMLAKQYVNASFLINQIVPFAGSVATAGTTIPLDASNINVGTEFMPFLLAWGAPGALGSIVLLYAGLAWSVRRLQPAVPLFSLLIFLRMAYVCVMSPFAPQAYTWMNFGFVGLCLVMQLLSAWLPGRTRAVVPSPSQTITPSP